MHARFANAEGTAVALTTEAGVAAALLDDPRLVGLTIEPFAPPGAGAVPEVITNAQGQAALRLAFLPDGTSRRTAAEAVIRAGVAATRDLPESDPARIRADLALIGWDQTNEWRRTGATVAAIAAQLGWAGEEVDALFLAAAAIDL